LFFAGLGIGLAGFNVFLSLGATLGIIFGAYAFYVLMTICCSEIRNYIENMKHY
jgi:hypothetical protein